MWKVLGDLTLSRPIPLALVVFTMLLNLYIIFHIKRHIVPGVTSRTFGLYFQIILLWQIRDLFYRLSGSEETAQYWDNLFSLGYMGFPALGVFFTLTYTGNHEQATKLWATLLLVIPPIVFQSLYGLDTQNVKYYYSPFWGWFYPNNQTTLGLMMITWAFLCSGLSLVMQARFAWKNRHIPVLAWQSLLIAAGHAFPFFLDIIIQGYTTQILKKPGIPLGSSTTVFFSIAVIIALRRHKLFQVQLPDEKAELQEFPPIAEIKVKSDTKIVGANPYASQVLGIYPNLQEPVPIHSVILDESHNRRQLREILAECITQNISINRKVVLNFKKYGAQPVILSAQPVYEDDKLDYILIVWRMPEKFA